MIEGKKYRIKTVPNENEAYSKRQKIREVQRKCDRKLPEVNRVLYSL